MKNKRSFIIIQAITIIFLSLSIIGMPYEYYSLMRWIVSPIFIFLAIKSYESKKEVWILIFAIMAGIYNPVIPLHLDRPVWIIINIASIITIISFLFIHKREYMVVYEAFYSFFKRHKVFIFVGIVLILIGSYACYQVIYQKNKKYRRNQEKVKLKEIPSRREFMEQYEEDDRRLKASLESLR